MSILQTVNLTKIYPGTKALDNISAQFTSGRVHAICGKNGSGKSTLINIFSGAVTPTHGQLFLDNKPLILQSPQDAIDKHIATVYQELSLFPGLTVTENIFMGRLPMKGKLIDWKRAHKEATNRLREFDITIKSTEIVAHLSMWERQMVEIVKAMSTNPRVLMLDEPTSSLAKEETKKLFTMIKKLKQRDVIILYVSHRLQELWEVADTCTVIRDGLYIGTELMSQLSHKKLVDMMFGTIQVKARPSDILPKSNTVLQVKNLSKKGSFENISFKVKEGEILGFAGMLGSGRTEILRGIFGADKVDSGEVIFQDKILKKRTPEIMKNTGFAMTSEDRKHEGLIQILSIHDNLCIAARNKMGKGPFISKSIENPYVENQISALDIKVSSPLRTVRSLSGGNQQKVVVGNWLNTEPKIMFFDEPSRGIDVHAKQQIFEIIWEQARKGVSSIMVSSEFEELLEVCNRILIIQNGKITGEVNPDTCSLEELYEICLGGSIQ